MFVNGKKKCVDQAVLELRSTCLCLFSISYRPAPPEPVSSPLAIFLIESFPCMTYISCILKFSKILKYGIQRPLMTTYQNSLQTQNTPHTRAKSFPPLKLTTHTCTALTPKQKHPHLQHSLTHTKKKKQHNTNKRRYPTHPTHTQQHTQNST